MTRTSPPATVLDNTWPAMVMTAGLGTRLAPLSSLRAKPALPVAGVPLAGRILRWLSAAGVRRAVLNLHHLPESITSVIGDGGDFGVEVRYSLEGTLLGSAGGPAHALPLLASDHFLLVNGDSLTDLDLARFVAHHRASGAAVTLALVPNPDPLHYGGVTVDAEGRVTGFTTPGPANRGWHFIGVQAVGAEVFAALDPDVPSNTIGGVYDRLAERSSRLDSCVHVGGEFRRHRHGRGLPRDLPGHRPGRGLRRHARRRSLVAGRGRARVALGVVG